MPREIPLTLHLPNSHIICRFMYINVAYKEGLTSRTFFILKINDVVNYVISYTREWVKLDHG